MSYRVNVSSSGSSRILPPVPGKANGICRPECLLIKRKTNSFSMSQCCRTGSDSTELQPMLRELGWGKFSGNFF